MLVKLVLVLVVGCLGNEVAGQVISFGRCPSVNVKQNFDLTQYLGKWYEYERFFAIFEAFSDCVSAEYSVIDNTTVKVNNTGFSTFTRRASIAIGDAKVLDPAVPAKLGVKFSENQPRGDYWVLDTDYTDYTVVWSCTQFGFANTQFCWILTRRPEGITAAKKTEIYNMLKGYGINPNHFSPTSQTNCPGRS